MASAPKDLSQRIRELLHKKSIVIIGDSVQRSVYKDLLLLIHEDRYLRQDELRSKGELTFLGDELVDGGVKEGLKNGINYIETRKITCADDIQLCFYFVTRCYSDYLAKILKDLETDPPDTIVMNSCLWDLHRYGEHGPAAFKTNLRKLLENLNKQLPDSNFIWVATLPVDKGCKAGFLDAGQYRMTVQRNDINEANFVAYEMVMDYGRTFIPLDKIFAKQLYNRASDGVHWNGVAHRQMTCILLTEMSKLWRRQFVAPLMSAPLPLPPPPPNYHPHRRSSSMPEMTLGNIPPMFRIPRPRRPIPRDLRAPCLRIPPPPRFMPFDNGAMLNAMRPSGKRRRSTIGDEQDFYPERPVKRMRGQWPFPTPPRFGVPFWSAQYVPAILWF